MSSHSNKWPGLWLSDKHKFIKDNCILQFCKVSKKGTLHLNREPEVTFTQPASGDDQQRFDIAARGKCHMFGLGRNKLFLALQSDPSQLGTERTKWKLPSIPPPLGVRAWILAIKKLLVLLSIWRDLWRLQNEQKAPSLSLPPSFLSGVELRPISIYLFHTKVWGGEREDMPSIFMQFLNDGTTGVPSWAQLMWIHLCSLYLSGMWLKATLD